MKIKDIIEIYNLMSQKQKYKSELKELLEINVFGHSTTEDYKLYELKNKYLN